MSTSKLLQSTLRAFHLDQPEATWEELSGRLKEIAEGVLSTPTEWELLDSQALVYADMQSDLKAIGSTAALTASQAKAVGLGQQIMIAAQERLQGDSSGLLGLIGKLDQQSNIDSFSHLPVSLSVSASNSLTFKSLSALYMAEQKDNVQASTMRDIRSTCTVVGDALGELNLKTHTRGDMVALKAKLLEDRKGSTVNKILTRLSTVMDWAVHNGYLDKSFDKGLKLSKDADSSREALSQDQVQALMDHSKTLQVDAWQRWALSLGVITGARIEELRQLTKSDVKQVGGVWVIDINRNDGKSAKTNNSVRVVPLTDGAYGFDLQAFLAFTDKADSKLFKLGVGQFSGVLNGTLRDVLDLKADRTQTFHSLRHSLAGALKAAEVPVGTAESILGHSSGSISYDLYGAGSAVEVGRMADALRKSFKLTKNN